jgi:hypothetical protein
MICEPMFVYYHESEDIANFSSHIGGNGMIYELKFGISSKQEDITNYCSLNNLLGRFDGKGNDRIDGVLIWCSFGDPVAGTYLKKSIVAVFV